MAQACDDEFQFKAPANRDAARPVENEDIADAISAAANEEGFVFGHANVIGNRLIAITKERRCDNPARGLSVVFCPGVVRLISHDHSFHLPQGRDEGVARSKIY
jgi:hypothetical protein